MKKIKRVAACVLSMAVLVGGFTSTTNMVYAAEQSTVAIEAQQKAKSINVNGNGIIRVIPDMATVSLGVMTEAVDSKTAINENSILMTKVTEAIKNAGISEKDIQTSGFNVYPKYNYSEKDGSSKIVGYTANNSVNVKIMDLTKLSAVINSATDAGANISNGVQFSVADTEKYYYEALTAAIGSANKKAQVIAKALNVSISAPAEVSETSYYYPGSFQLYGAYTKEQAALNDSASVPISVGEIEISAQVSVKYEY